MGRLLISAVMRLLAVVVLLLSISQIKSSIAVYWGSNDADSSTGELPSLVEYCKKAVDMVVISDLLYTPGGDDPQFKLKIAGTKCTTEETNDLHCPGIGEQIKECQRANTKVLISLKGPYDFGQGGNATQFASLVWNKFFSDSSNGRRPFDDASLDGIVIHLGNGTDIGFNMFIRELAGFMKQDNSGKKYYISAVALNCMDSTDIPVIQSISEMHALDYIGVLQYSNCLFDPNDHYAFINGWKMWAELNVPIYVGLNVSDSSIKCPDNIKELIRTINHECISSSLFRGVIVRDASLDKKNDGAYMGCIRDLLSSDVSLDDDD